MGKIDQNLMHPLQLQGKLQGKVLVHDPSCYEV